MISPCVDEIKFLEDCLASDDLEIIKDALMKSIDVIKMLVDENDSVWSLIEEMRNSDISTHKDLIQNELNKKIAETFSLISKQVVLA